MIVIQSKLEGGSVLKSIALGTFFLTSLAGVASADEINIEGADLSRDIHCTSSDVGISGVGNTITLTGQCKTVQVYGARHKVTFETAEKVFVSGSAHKVSGGTARHLEVDLVDNDVRSTLKPDADGPATLNVTGNKNAVEVSLEGSAAIDVAGSNQDVTWTSGQGVAPPKVQISGIKNSVKRGK